MFKRKILNVKNFKSKRQHSIGAEEKWSTNCFLPSQDRHLQKCLYLYHCSPDFSERHDEKCVTN